MRSRHDSGQATPVAGAIVAIGIVLTMAIGEVAGKVVDAARARTAADAAALASVEGGRIAASRLADTHRATLVHWSRDGRDVIVTVRVGESVAVARATGGSVATDAG